MKLRFVEPSVAEPVTFDSTKPESAFVEPSSTKVKQPPVISELESLSIVLVNTNGFETSPTVVIL